MNVVVHLVIAYTEMFFSSLCPSLYSSHHKIILLRNLPLSPSREVRELIMLFLTLFFFIYFFNDCREELALASSHLDPDDLFPDILSYFGVIS